VNIAKVLREYKRAAAQGKAITAKKQEFADRIKRMRESLANKSRQIQSATDEKEKSLLQKEGKALSREIDDLTEEAERVLSELSDRTIIDVYKKIRDAIVALAKGRGLDVVQCYPDAATPEDEKKPALAQLKLQTPALIPFYLNKEFDLTERVIEDLNKSDD
jgi:Skp family chaperone for outer membrane proteins